MTSGKPVPVNPKLHSLENLSRLLDSVIHIPGTNISMGLDSLIGLIPGVGDAISGMISTYIVYEGARLGLPKYVLFKMGWNVVIDSLVGAIPILGDLFDIAFKANLKNLALIQQHIGESHGERTAAEISSVVKMTVAGVVLAITLVVAAVGWFLLKMIAAAL
jgi:hypothetical protein